MKLIFFGTPEYVIPILHTLYKTYAKNIVAVVTQSPKPSGREQTVIHSPVDNWAYKRKIPIFTDLTAKKLPPADLGIVAAYGNKLTENVLNHFPKGILNIHPSLLPQFRWASAVQAAIVTDTNPTGVTIIKMDEKFDHGPIVSSFKEEVLPNDTTGSLRSRLFEKSGQFLVELLPAYQSGKIMLKAQDHTKSSFASIIKKEDAFIRPYYLHNAIEGKLVKDKWKINFIKDYPTSAGWSLVPNPHSLDRFIRAMNPWPIAWTFLRQGYGGQAKSLKILSAHVEELVPNNYSLVPDLVQLEGKNPVTWKEFKRGYPNLIFI